MSESDEPPTIRRALNVVVFAPVGVALSVVENLPAFVAKGRQRFDADLRNARVVGEFVVTLGRGAAMRRMSKLLHAEPVTATSGAESGAANEEPARTVAPASSATPSADPADGALVERALAGYDTLSAAQVVRRLESLGTDELRAVHRHEVSHRHRRTILNRARQLLDDTESIE